jgi:hypothetical protein
MMVMSDGASVIFCSNFDAPQTVGTLIFIRSSILKVLPDRVVARPLSHRIASAALPQPQFAWNVNAASNLLLFCHCRK